MKAANIDIAAVFADCPHCGGPLYDPTNNGTQAIPVLDYDRDQRFPCTDCGEESALPAAAYKSINQRKV